MIFSAILRPKLNFGSEIWVDLDKFVPCYESEYVANDFSYVKTRFVEKKRNINWDGLGMCYEWESSIENMFRSKSEGQCAVDWL